MTKGELDAVRATFETSGCYGMPMSDQQWSDVLEHLGGDGEIDPEQTHHGSLFVRCRTSLFLYRKAMRRDKR